MSILRNFQQAFQKMSKKNGEKWAKKMSKKCHFLAKSGKKWSQKWSQKTPKKFAISVSKNALYKISVFDTFLDDFCSKNGNFPDFTFFKKIKIKMKKQNPIFSLLKSSGLLRSRNWPKPSSQKVTKMAQKVGYFDISDHFFVRTLKSWDQVRTQKHQFSPYKTQNEKNGFSMDPPRATIFYVTQKSNFVKFWQILANFGKFCQFLSILTKNEKVWCRLWRGVFHFLTGSWNFQFHEWGKTVRFSTF